MLLRPVSASDLESLLAGLKSSTPTPKEGIFGPDSISWQINRESALFLAAGRAALLQLAHPWVATAIAEHSRTLKDPIGRFHNTFRVIYTMIFGSVGQAIAASRSLHGLHQSIRGILPESAGRFSRGTAYEANEISALCWVYATLVDSALLAYELLLPPLNDIARERYFVESLKMAALFGIPPEHLPATWAEFRAYMESTFRSDLLGLSPATREFARHLQAGAGLTVPPPFWYRALTIQLLPPRLRENFGFAYGEKESTAARRAVSLLRWLYPKLPSMVRFVGPYNEAQSRLNGRRPGFSVRLSNRLWTGQPMLLAMSDHEKPL